MASNCNLSSLEEYVPSETMPWDINRVKHFYRRFSYGATPTTLYETLLVSPSDLIDNLIDEAIAMPTTTDPGWGYYDKEEGIAYTGSDSYWQLLRAEFFYLIFTDLRKDHIRGRMTMFMNELFVSSTYNQIPYMYQQYVTRQKYALGNFKDFIHDMGLDATMLKYLNNYENKSGKPNENYARELLELFTLGVDNGYTETDIQEIARAFTGYNSVVTTDGVILFNENDTFDSDEKTIFEQTGNWGYSDVITILFEQKGSLIASYICGKLYEYFVSFTPNETIISELTQTFIDNDFELAPVLRQLFKSEHFFDDACIGVLIKSPLDLAILHDNELSYTTETLDVITAVSSIDAYVVINNLEMNILNPPNVSGWLKDTAWINSVTISERTSTMQNYTRLQYKSNPETYSNFVKTLFETTEDADVVARGIVDFCLSKSLVYEEEYLEAISVFKEGVPENYFTNGVWTLDYTDIAAQVKQLINYIITMPEFQLK
jgi:hypothetical protein